MKNLLPMLAIFFVFGCFPNNKIDRTIFLPGGEKGYAISCRDSINICYREASYSCSGGYEIVKKTVVSGQKERFAAESESASGSAGSYESYDFLIKCEMNKQKIKNKKAKPVAKETKKLGAKKKIKRKSKEKRKKVKKVKE